MRLQSYRLRTFYSGLPSSTPAVQGELHYGKRCAVPAFGFVDRESKKHVSMFNPEWAKKIEANLRQHGEGLLTGGSSWSNIYTGGATQQESHFCTASLGLGDMKRTLKFAAIFWFIVLQFSSVLRLIGMLILEVFIGLSDAVRGILKGESLLYELLFLFPRVFVAVGLREVVTVGASIDLARGLPIIHVNFLGYDEQSHRRGPQSAFAHWTLKGIDHCIRRLYAAARRSGRRDYQVWIFSDHGQERTRSFAEEFDGGIEAIIREQIGGLPQVRHWRSRRRRTAAALVGGIGTQRRLDRQAARDLLTADELETFSVAAMGPVGHVYLAQALDAKAKRALAVRLVREGKVPGVLYRGENGELIWHHANGEATTSDEMGALLPQPAALKPLVLEDLRTLCAHPYAGELVLLGWNSGHGGPWTFPLERGAHAGPGLHETQGFALLPARVRLPEGCEEYIRPGALRAAALHVLGRERLDAKPVRRRKPQAHTHLRVMTYNIHGCVGMDGKCSPRRIADVIDDLEPDIVALQEVDLGRVRSHRHDQADVIARSTGMYAVFCPTVVVGHEQYGHALLSRFPFEVMRNTTFADRPEHRSALFFEPRGALWARLSVEGVPLHLITAHLGLTSRERHAQVAELLGEHWLGSVPPGEAVVVGGDFNLLPDAGPYNALAAHLRDVQRVTKTRRPLKTFSTWYLLSRIDHLFVSDQFDVTGVDVPRNDLTRVASDHFPLVADLVLHASKPATVRKPSETTTAQ